MDAKTRHLQMTEADLLGHAPEELACDQCSSGCGFRIGRVFQGKALIVCARKDATKEVLAALKRR